MVTSHAYGVKRFRKALFYFLGGRAAQAAARAVLVLVLVRVLPVADYGIYMLVVGTAEMLIAVASFGILPIGYRYLPELLSRLSARKLYKFVLSLTVIQLTSICLIAFALSLAWDSITPHLGFSAQQTELARIAGWLFLVLPAFRFCSELLEALLEQAKSQFVRALMPLGRVVGIGILIGSDATLDLSKIIAVDIFVTLGCLVLAWIQLARSLVQLSRHDAVGDDRIPLREMVRFGWHMAVVDLLGATATPGALRIVLANVLGVTTAGLFAFLQSLERLVSRYLPGVLLRGIVRPIMISRHGTPGGMEVLRGGSGLLMKMNSLIVALGASVIAVAGDEVVYELSGGKFENAGMTLLLMFLILSVSAQRSIITMLMQITGHTQILRATAFIAPVLLFCVWWVGDAGLNVAIAVIGCGSILTNVISMAVLSRSANTFEIDWRGLGVTNLIFGVTVVFALVMREWLHPVLTILLGFGLLGVLLLILRPFNRSEVAMIESGLGKRIASQVRKIAQG